MKTTVTLTQQEMIDVLKKYYSTQYMTEVDVVLLPTEKEEPKSTPWYPDNSGEWIECNGVRPVGLSGNTVVEVIIQTERNDQNWVSCADCVDEWLWGTIVAYKVVEKVD